MYQIGVDIGGTNIKIGILDEAVTLCAVTSVPFPHTTAEDMAQKIRQAVETLGAGKGISMEQIESVGAVVPGSISPDGSSVIDAYNLDFHNVPLRSILQSQFPGIPVRIANDADGAALAELYAGAFKGKKNAVLYTLGTGLGGGIILGGKLFNGGCRRGTELGHAILVDGGAPCTCGVNGCAEVYCSATGLVKEARKQVASHPDSLMVRLAGGDPSKLDAQLVTDCAEQGDEAAKAAFAVYLDHLSSAIATIYNILDPEVFAIGGGLSGAGSTLFDPLQTLVDEKCFFQSRGDLVPAVLGNNAGMIGAALLHRDASV